MVRNSRIFLIFIFTFIAIGCSSVISKDIRKQADKSLPFTQIAANLNAYKGQTVIWGGEIISNETLNDGSVLIEVYERPLASRDAPDLDKKSEGRFLIQSKKFLDPYVFKAGRKITVGGVVQGEETRPIGKLDYRYPVVLVEEIHLWKESYYYPAYDPWWPDYPGGWGYPRVGVGLGFGFSHYYPGWEGHNRIKPDFRNEFMLYPNPLNKLKIK